MSNCSDFWKAPASPWTGNPSLWTPGWWKPRDRYSLAEAAAEEARRRAARGDFEAFIKYTFHGYQENWHHQRKARALQAVIDGRIKRLIIEEPPRHGKSEQVSRRLPAAFFGAHPTHQVVAASYNLQQAKKESRAVQRVMTSPAYGALFPTVRLPRESRSGTDRWTRRSDFFEIVGTGGAYLATGIGGTLTGNGMHLGIIDDPIKNAEEADSEAIREAFWEWYLSTFLSRDEGDAAVVLNQTRWHEDDPAGRVLESAKESGEEWVRLRFPAIQDMPPSDLDPRQLGEALWPGKFSVEKLAQIKSRYADSGRRWWDALYQQRPSAIEGSIFKRDYWQTYRPRKLTDYIQIVQSWDTAHSKKKTAAFSVCTTWGITDRGTAHLLHVWRDRVEFPALKKAAVALAREYGIKALLIEDKASGKDLIPELREGTKLPIEPVEPTQDKIARAHASVDMIECGRIRIPEDSPPWLEPYLKELAECPTGKFWDQVDSTTQFIKWYRDNFKQPAEAVLKHPGRQSRMEE